MFRPCIDLHEGKVKQIVGGTIGEPSALRTNFVSDRSAAWFAELYRRDGLAGGHVIMLGPGNETEARAALAAFPGGLQIGGGVNAQNAPRLARGRCVARHRDQLGLSRRTRGLGTARRTGQTAGKNRLVLDLSCRQRGENYLVVTGPLAKIHGSGHHAGSAQKLAGSCAEFLVHAVDAEGLCHGH